MGYKAAVKVFKQWKILRGDKVDHSFCTSFADTWSFCSFQYGALHVEKSFLIRRNFVVA